VAEKRIKWGRGGVCGGGKRGGGDTSKMLSAMRESDRQNAKKKLRGGKIKEDGWGGGWDFNPFNRTKTCVGKTAITERQRKKKGKSQGNHQEPMNFIKKAANVGGEREKPLRKNVGGPTMRGGDVFDSNSTTRAQ